jgi:PAS domain S-box-containing protein
VVVRDQMMRDDRAYLATLGLSSPMALEGFLEAAPDAIVVVDRSGHIVIVNQLAERLFAYSRQELLGMPIEGLVPQRFRERHAGYRNDYFREPRTRPMGEGRELSGRRKDGSEFPVEISLSPLKTETVTVVISIIRDISERKLVEIKLRSSLKEKEVLLQEIHHRVKNNLQIVSSMLNLQTEKLSDTKAIELFKESQNRVRSIALFHEKLYQSRDLGRIEIGEYIKGLANGSFATYGVDPDDIVLAVHTEDIPLDVDAAISCGLIVNELVSNSLKHAFPDRRKGQVEVTLRSAGTAAGTDVILEVADNGIGFPASLDIRNPSTLGLKLVAIFTEQVRGTMDLAREGGTRFSLRFTPGKRP